MHLKKIHEKIRLLKLDPENFRDHTVESLMHFQETFDTLTSQIDDMSNEIDELKKTQNMLISENRKLKAMTRGVAQGLSNQREQPRVKDDNKPK